MATTTTEHVKLTEKAGGKIVEVQISDRLEHADYETLLPEVERLIKRHGKIRMLIYLHNFAGWTAGALWEDLKFDFAHFNDIERFAFAGESKWHEGMAVFCRPFTTAEIRYFDHDKLPDARQWIESDLA